MLHVNDGRFPFLGDGALPDVPNQFDGLFAFVFADPASELPIGIVDIDISGASGGYTYKTDQTFARTLAASKISGIVFETTDTYDDSSSQIRIDVVEATDDAGNPENAAALFDSFFEWNASPY